MGQQRELLYAFCVRNDRIRHCGSYSRHWLDLIRMINVLCGVHDTIPLRACLLQTSRMRCTVPPNPSLNACDEQLNNHGPRICQRLPMPQFLNFAFEETLEISMDSR